MDFRVLIKEVLLIEGRKEDVLEKYLKKGGKDWDAFLVQSNITDEEEIREELKKLINYFSKNDPSGSNKYLDWMVKIFLNSMSEHDSDEIIDVIQDFHENIDKFNNRLLNELNSYEHVPVSYLNSEEKIKRAPKDINSYDSLNALIFVLKVAKSIVTKKDVKREETDFILNNDDILILSPKTHRSSCYYGATTKWCTTSMDDYHFNEHHHSGVLIYVILKNELLKERHPKVNDKLAMFFPYTENLEESIREANYYNELDEELDLDPNPSVILGGYWREIVSYLKKRIESYLEDKMNYTIDENMSTSTWLVLNEEEFETFKSNPILTKLFNEGRIMVEKIKNRIPHFGGEFINYHLSVYDNDYFTQDRLDKFTEDENI